MPDSTAALTCPHIALERTADGILHIRFSGEWRLGEVCAEVPQAIEAAEDDGVSSLVLETSRLGTWDTSLLVVVLRLVNLAGSRNIKCSTTALPPGLDRLLQLALTVPPNKEAKKTQDHTGFFAYIGALTLSFPATARAVLDFIGEAAIAFFRFCVGRSVCRKRDILLQLQECGIEALPIVSLISLLVGFILAFVGVVQLRMFGAEIYVSSLVAVGMTRIMGAIMTGIIMAGRTGASFAAVLGTMQVSEEIDALTTQGLRPSEFLILPRLMALALMTPLLVLYADFMGIIGGFIIGVGVLDLDPAEYLSFTKVGFDLANLWVGVIHGFVFGVVVSLTGCYQGVRCGRSAAAVGTATTAAVVYSIVGIVISTALLTVLFNILGI